jgi:pentafunctional AROM polypeptide
VEEQIRVLQKMSNLPILFTIRTKSQRGKFPNPAEVEALALMLLAASLRIEYIDIEVKWSASPIDAITLEKGSRR